MQTKDLLIALALVASPAAAVVASAPAASWEIGPVIKGKNHSVGMSFQPAETANGWSFEFPTRGWGHVNYVTTHTGSLLGKSRIVMRYRIVAPPRTRFFPQEAPEAPATLALYFQRRGDNWTARRQFEHYRWYAVHSKRVVLAPGEYEISLPLDGANWKSLGSATGTDAPEQFRNALAEASQIGFVLGGGLSAGHGVYASERAKFEMLSFSVI